MSKGIDRDALAVLDMIIDEMTDEARQMAQDEAGQGWGEERLPVMHAVRDAVRGLLESPRDEMTEADMHAMLAAARARFGWTGSMFTRGDVESLVMAEGGEMTEEMWDAVRHSWAWRKGMPDALTVRGWHVVADALDEVREEGS